jgi:hypothetical protein
MEQQRPTDTLTVRELIDLMVSDDKFTSEKLNHIATLVSKLADIKEIHEKLHIRTEELHRYREQYEV